MRTKTRTKKQWEQTHETREDVRKFMTHFHGNLAWESDGPPDTEVDQLLCYLIYLPTKDENDQYPPLGVALIQTWLRGGWSIFVETTNASEKETIAAILRMRETDDEVTLPAFLPSLPLT